MGAARLSVRELMALLSPPVHAVLSNLPADPIQAVADRLAAHDDCVAPRLEAEVPGVLQSLAVLQLQVAMQKAVDAYLRTEPIPSDARRFLAERMLEAAPAPARSSSTVGPDDSTASRDAPPADPNNKIRSSSDNPTPTAAGEALDTSVRAAAAPSQHPGSSDPVASEAAAGHPAAPSDTPSDTPKDMPSLALVPASGGELVAYDFTGLFREKLAQHMPGTREWAFSEIECWLDDPQGRRLFWLMGGGGTGKSVLSAALLERDRRSGRRRVAAWHFCRHDNKEQSAPVNLLCSLAAMLTATLPAYGAALAKNPKSVDEALASSDPKVVFETLLAAPLREVPALEDGRAMLLMIDALDEIPKEAQKPLLGVLVNQLAQLPEWLRFLVTSRDEPAIRASLAKFEPKELRADEAKNRADVEVRLGATP